MAHNEQTLSIETINNLKSKYRDFLATNSGKICLKNAVESKKKWLQLKKFSNFTANSASVKKELLPKSIQGRMKLVKINPIGVNNVCFKNAEVFSGDGFTSRMGYNMCSCPCGKKMGFELHSLNKKDGKLYDFTKDFNDENEKWFIELNTDSKASPFIQCWGPEAFSVNDGCKCPISFTLCSGVNEVTISQFEKILDKMETTKIICL